MSVAETSQPAARLTWAVLRLRLRQLTLVIGRSLAVFVPVLLVGTFVTFLLGVLSGLSPAHLQLGESATPEAVARIERQWGLDRPFLTQYFDWLTALLRGDLGTSWYNGRGIADLLRARAVISLSVAGLALVIGVVGGAFSARWPRCCRPPGSIGASPPSPR